jgi:hypothetical protein
MERKELVAYAAGIFDGEGTVSISRIRERKGTVDHSPRMSIIVVQKVPCSLDLLIELFGGKRHKVTRRNRLHDYWRWVLTAKRAADALTEMLPYLREKREQAYAAIEFQDHMNAVHHHRGNPIPEEVKRYRQQMAEYVSALKRRAGAETECDDHGMSVGSPWKRQSSPDGWETSG